mgnify:CR=1 FL=1
MSKRESDKLKIIISLSNKTYIDIGIVLSKKQQPLTIENSNLYYHNTANKLSPNKNITLKTALTIINACEATLQYHISEKNTFIKITLEDLISGKIPRKIYQLTEVTKTDFMPDNILYNTKISFDDLIDMANVCSCDLEAQFNTFAYKINSVDTHVNLKKSTAANLKAEAIINLYNQNMKPKEIAKTIGCTTQYVYSILSKIPKNEKQVSK